MTRVLANASAADRNGTDFYPTPPECTVALLNYLDLPTGTVVWEPAAGEGHIVEVLADWGLSVLASDLHPAGRYVTESTDYLSAPLPAGVDVVITNPPFSIAQAFIEHTLDLGVPFALLLKSQYWHSKGRRALFERHRPTAVLPLTWRPDFLFGAKSASPTMECLWTVWGSEPAAATVYEPLSKPNLAGDAGLF